MPTHGGKTDRHQGGSRDDTGCEDAVSELIGAIVLTAVIVAGVSIVGVVLWSQPPPLKVPSLSAVIFNQSCRIDIYHNGGDVLDRQAVRIFVDGANKTANFQKRGDAGTWTRWVNGDTLQYAPATCIQTPKRVDIIYNDGTVASVISTAFFGAYQPPGLTPGPTPTPSPPLSLPWYSCSWSSRKNITIDKSRVSGSNSDFPVLISLGSDPDLAENARTDGFDILFTTTDGTKLPHEIETYTSASGALVAWVKVPAVTSTANTTILMYYGSPSSPNQQDKNNVWTASFQSVWHLNEMTGGSGAIKDSTSSANHGTDQGSPTLGVTGKFGNAVTLDGINDYITTTTSYNQPQTFTASLWFRTTNTAATRKIFGFESTQTALNSANYDRHIYIDTGGYVLDGVYDGTTKIVATGSGAKNDGNWHHAVMTHASTTLKLYVDGSFIGQNTTAGAENFVGYWRMGSYRLTGWPRSLGDGYFPGTLDEVRTSTVERSSNWITTEYNNQNSPATFYYLGNQEQWTC
jgi:hypothetical protein